MVTSNADVRRTQLVESYRANADLVGTTPGGGNWGIECRDIVYQLHKESTPDQIALMLGISVKQVNDDLAKHNETFDKPWR
jgi:hypothetical protein